MGWLERLFKGPENADPESLAAGMVLTLTQRTNTLIEFLQTEGLAQKTQLHPEAFKFQCLLLLAFPFYAMMPTEFGLHSERLRKEFVKYLVHAFVGDAEQEFSQQDMSEIEAEVVSIFHEYNDLWQSASAEGGGEIMRRLGPTALRNILGREDMPDTPKVWYRLFLETNNAFKNSIGFGRRFTIVG